MTSAPEKFVDFLNAFLDAYNTGDAAQAASFYAENAVYMPSHHPAVRGRSEIESFHRQTMAQFSPQFSLRPEQTICSGHLIVQWGRYAVSLHQGDGDIVEDAGKYVVVCQETAEAKFQFLWDIDNSDSAGARGDD